MNSSTTRRRKASVPASQACVNCQKRKTRCIGTNGPGQSCSYCSRAGKPCSFEAPPQRTALTRRNLDAAERRCSRLERLIRSLHPDMDIASALESFDHQEPSATGPLVPGDTQLPESPAISQPPAGEYEWNEDVSDPPATGSLKNNMEDGDGLGDGLGDGVGDGMATLVTDKAGYLGELYRWLKDHPTCSGTYHPQVAALALISCERSPHFSHRRERALRMTLPLAPPCRAGHLWFSLGRNQKRRHRVPVSSSLTQNRI